MNLSELRRDIAIVALKQRGWPKEWWLVASDFSAVWKECYGAPPPAETLARHSLDMAGCLIRPVPELPIDFQQRP